MMSNRVDIKCKHCIEELWIDVGAPVVGHYGLISALSTDSSREKVLYLLGLIPNNPKISSVYRAQAIEVLRGHYPDVYNSMSGLFILQ